MKAIVYSSPGKFKYTDVPKPTVKSDEVLIQIKSCGLCRTDIHIHEGHFIAKFPLINGHEFAGIVEEVGEKVQDFKVGDRVLADNTELCGACYFCRNNQPLYCENFVSHGCNCAGGFAEYVAIKAKKVFKIKNLSFREAVMVEPTACAIHGLDIIKARPGSEVLLFGAGPTGNILAQLLKQNGAAYLTVAAPPGIKLDLIKKLAADEIVPVDKKDYSKHERTLITSHPKGFDIVIDATGVPQLLSETPKYAKVGGQIIAYGVYPEESNIIVKPYDIFKRELTIKGSFAQTHCFGRALLYLENKQIKVDQLITHEIHLKDYGKALKIMKERQGVKIAIIPS
ncbi:zinc-dependent alcohol dehydrogenase family protein [Candidatus Aerophobetes bacterium]|nr:zinc-dependent alcohol dehydrogenase family protein [Candidatus Aerophobetes bacterium]